MHQFINISPQIIIMQPEFIEMDAKAKEEGKLYLKYRFVYSRIKKHLQERVFIAIIGPRGAGKTIMLKQLLCETESSFYISLDTQKPEEGLYNLAKDLIERGIRFLLLDEVHGYPGFEKELKKIHDFLPQINIVLTSSSAISLHEASVDLSRRVRIIYCPPFSLREFISFEKNETPPPLSLNILLDEKKAKEYYGKVLHTESAFESYLKGRNYPFTIGKIGFMPLFRSILEKIINDDLVIKERVSLEESFEIRKVLAFIGKSPSEGISYSSIASNCGITKYKSEKFVSLLEKALVLHAIMPKGTNLNKEPKILIAPPYRLLYRDYEDCIGAMREDFFVDSMIGLGFQVSYLKSMRGKKIPDYIVDDLIFEIGGVSKSASQFKGFKSKERIILTQPGAIDAIRRPLFLIGMLDPLVGL